MCRYKKIDLENWCRKEHYLYYTNSLNVEVNMTANIDVSELLTFVIQMDINFIQR